MKSFVQVKIDPNVENRQGTNRAGCHKMPKKGKVLTLSQDEVVGERGSEFHKPKKKGGGPSVRYS